MQLETAIRCDNGRFRRSAAAPLRAVVVGELTHVRRKADAAGRFFRLLGLSLALGAHSANAAWHDVADIAGTAETFLAEHIGPTDGRTTLRASPLDARLQMPECSQELDAFLQRGAKVASRMTVGVRCDGESPWKVYVTVDVIVTEAVVVAAKTLSSGHVLRREDLRIAERDVSNLTRGYVSRTDDVIGRRLKHQLIEGRVLTPSMMRASIMIRRGQSVTITIRNETLDISMEGKALMDGAVNQRIRVENIASRRVVEGIVRSPEHVEVLVF